MGCFVFVWVLLLQSLSQKRFGQKRFASTLPLYPSSWWHQSSPSCTHSFPPQLQLPALVRKPTTRSRRSFTKQKKVFLCTISCTTNTMCRAYSACTRIVRFCPVKPLVLAPSDLPTYLFPTRPDWTDRLVKRPLLHMFALSCVCVGYLRRSRACGHSKRLPPSLFDWLFINPDKPETRHLLIRERETDDGMGIFGYEGNRNTMSIVRPGGGDGEGNGQLHRVWRYMYPISRDCVYSVWPFWTKQ